MKNFSFYRALFFSLNIWAVVTLEFSVNVPPCACNINHVVYRRHTYIESIYVLKNFVIAYKQKFSECSYSYDSIVGLFNILNARWKLEIRGS